MWFDSVITKQSKEFEKLPKNDINDLIPFFSGFNRLNYHHNKIDPTTDPICRWCGEKEETTNHLAFDCGPWLTMSRRFIGDTRSGTWTLKGVLEFIRSSSLREELMKKR